MEWSGHLNGAYDLPRKGLTLGLLILAGMVSGPLRASDWVVTPGVGLGGTYSDNIQLAPPGEEQGSFVAEVIPQLSVRRVGRKLNLGFNYNLQALYRTAEDEAELFHQFAGDARSEVVREWLFLDVATTFNQQNLLATDLGGDNIANRGNRTDVFAYAISPFVSHRFGTFGTGEARFTYTGVNNSASFDSNSDTVNLRFQSGGDFQRTPWSAFFLRQENNPSEGESSEFLRAGSQLGYQVTSQLEIFTILGYEKNDFFGPQPESETNGFSWSLGAAWVPSRRTRISGGYSERPFGRTFFADISYSGRRATWQASYNEDYSTTSQAQLEQQATLITDSVIGEVETVVIPPPSLTVEQVFLSQRFQGSLSYLWRRTNATLSVFADERSFQTTGDSQRVYGGAVGASRALSRKNQLTLVAGAQRIRDSATDLENTLWGANLQFNRSVNGYVTGSLGYGYQKQESDTAANKYTENRVTVGVIVTFEPRKL